MDRPGGQVANREFKDSWCTVELLIITLLYQLRENTLFDSD